MTRDEFQERLDRAYPGLPTKLRADLIDFAGEVSRCHINSLRNGGTFWVQQMALASQDFLTKVARGNDTKRKVIETEEEARSASQENPVAYAVFAENGNIRIWCADPIQAETLRQQYGDQIKPLYSAPVQGEPVGEVRFELGAPSSIFAELYSESLPALAPGTKLYVAPQPVVQQPIRSDLAFDASVHLTNWLNMNWCECEGAHTCGYNEVKRTRDALLVAAEQRPVEQQLAPDVAGVAEDADPLPFWEPCNPGCDPEFNGVRSRHCADLCEAAFAALAAHRKQGGEE